MKPEASEAALELYAALEPAFTQGDEEREWATLKFCIALVSGDIDFIHEIVVDEHEGAEVPGWEILLNPETCPAVALPYLAQFVGARLTDSMTEAEQRAAIKDPEGFDRGTIPQIEAVAKRSLTGSKAVVITERYTGKAWRLRIETLEEETPEPSVTQAAIEAEAKPIGILLFFNQRVNWTWGEILAEAATYPSWKAFREAFATWFLARTWEP